MNFTPGQLTPVLAPSLLAGDHAMLAASAAMIRDAGIRWAHVDIMDGHFVPNMTFGPQMLRDLRRHEPDLFYDVHLMLDNPAVFIEPFVNAGAGLVSIHVEAPVDHKAELRRIRELGAACGIVINPETPAGAVLPFIPFVDLVLVMTVHPGRGGQPFMSGMLPKIREIDAEKQKLGAAALVEVDGGIDLRSAPQCLEAGAQVLVAGTSFFRSEDKKSFATNILARNSD